MADNVEEMDIPLLDDGKPTELVVEEKTEDSFVCFIIRIPAKMSTEKELHDV